SASFAATACARAIGVLPLTLPVNGLVQALTYSVGIDPQPTGHEAMLVRFIKDECGATAIEYGLIVAVLSLAIVGSLGLLMNNIENNFDYISNIVTDASSGN
ncbi:MAG: Flp family type IVb pilin, partial [Aliihoeflea sp.]|uniref:Flp family type IVb pilin n=2 Tax=Phyllobacteriaceae TaxID=69277 RepID=UPI0040333199